MDLNLINLLVFIPDHLTIDDLRAVRKAVWDARGAWKDIGIELDLKVTDLDVISGTNHGNVNKCFSEMLTLWLKRVNPPPKWSAMVEALNEPAVGFEDLAEKVERSILSDTTDSGPAKETTGEYNIASMEKAREEIQMYPYFDIVRLIVIVMFCSIYYSWFHSQHSEA